MKKLCVCVVSLLIAGILVRTNAQSSVPGATAPIGVLNLSFTKTYEAPTFTARFPDGGEVQFTTQVVADQFGRNVPLNIYVQTLDENTAFFVNYFDAHTIDNSATGLDKLIDNGITVFKLAPDSKITRGNSTVGDLPARSAVVTGTKTIDGGKRPFTLYIRSAASGNRVWSAYAYSRNIVSANDANMFLDSIRLRYAEQSTGKLLGEWNLARVMQPKGGGKYNVGIFQVTFSTTNNGIVASVPSAFLGSSKQDIFAPPFIYRCIRANSVVNGKVISGSRRESIFARSYIQDGVRYYATFVLVYVEASDRIVGLDFANFAAGKDQTPSSDSDDAKKVSEFYESATPDALWIGKRGNASDLDAFLPTLKVVADEFSSLGGLAARKQILDAWASDPANGQQK